MFKGIKHKVLKLLGLYKLYWSNRPNGLYCFNYHRIGKKENTEYDPNVFSCDAEQFEHHIIFLQQHFTVISEQKLIDIIEKDGAFDDRYALITFDDGYIDNYELAFPILRKHNCPAIMYLATDFISKNIVPWWDEVAWLVKNNPDLLSLLDWQLPSKVWQANIDDKIRLVLRTFKDNQDNQIESKLNEMRSKSNKQLNTDTTRESLFISWEMVREMSKNGVNFGSQTESHRILSQLSEKEQYQELRNSKEEIEAKLATTVNSVAYPVGGEKAFTHQTEVIAEHCHYLFGMSFIAGINHTIGDQKFRLKRLSIDSNCSTTDIKNLVGKTLAS